MQFCPNDGLLMYLKCNKQTLEYECLKCKHQILYEDNCVCRQQYSNSMDDFARLMVNPYTIHDPTLPEHEMKCLNSKCPAKKMLYYRHDPANMRHLFICKECRQVWTFSGGTETDNTCQPRFLFELDPVDSVEVEADTP